MFLMIPKDDSQNCLSEGPLEDSLFHQIAAFEKVAKKFEKLTIAERKEINYNFTHKRFTTFYVPKSVFL